MTTQYYCLNIICLKNNVAGYATLVETCFIFIISGECWDLGVSYACILENFKRLINIGTHLNVLNLKNSCNCWRFYWFKSKTLGLWKPQWVLMLKKNPFCFDWCFSFIRKILLIHTIFYFHVICIYAFFFLNSHSPHGPCMYATNRNACVLIQLYCVLYCIFQIYFG